MKFSELLEKKRNNSLNSEEQKIYSELIRSYNRIGYQGKENLTVDELRRIKTLRSEYTNIKGRTIDRVDRIKQAIEKSGDDNLFEYIEKTLPKRAGLSIIDNLSNVKSFTTNEYIMETENRLKAMKDFLSGEYNSSKAIKQITRADLTVQQRGAVKLLMKATGQAVYNVDDVDEILNGIKTVMKESELRGIEAYEGVYAAAEAALDLRQFGIKGEDGIRADALEELAMVLNRRKR